MSDKKNIDRLFQEKFKDFEVKPNANVWTGIQDKMQQPLEKTKTVFPIWLRFVSIAAGLVLLFGVGKFVINNNNTKNNNTKVVDTNTTENTNTTSNSNNINKTVVSTNKTNNLENNNTSTEDKSLNQKVTTINENDSKNNSTSNTKQNKTNSINTNRVIVTNQNNKNAIETNQNKVNNSNSKLERANGILKEDNVNANRLVVNENNNSKNNNTNDASANLENRSNLNTSNNSQKLAQNTSVDNKNNTLSNSNGENNNTNNTSNKQNTKAANKNNTTTNTAVVTTDSEKEKEEEKMMKPDSANSSNTIEEALAKIEDLDEKEENVNKWSVSANAAPVYYNTLGKGSHIDNQFIDNPKNGEINTSYGVKVGYNIGNKLKVRSGINKLNLSYDTANVIVYNSVSNVPNASNLRSIDFIPDTQGQTFSVLSADNLVVQQITGLIGNKLNAAISQRISYFEVPLELEYALVNKKFGLHVIGGASAFILSDNEVVSEITNQKRKIGEANNINDLSYSANIGLGIDYKFNNKLRFNLEPTFKYQMNAYSETSGNFKPYIIGVYTGFSYKF